MNVKFVTRRSMAALGISVRMWYSEVVYWKAVSVAFADMMSIHKKVAPVRLNLAVKFPEGETVYAPPKLTEMFAPEVFLTRSRHSVPNGTFSALIVTLFAACTYTHEFLK